MIHFNRLSRALAASLFGAGCAAALSGAAQAQPVVLSTTDAVIRESLCLGKSCADEPVFPDDLASGLMLQDSRVRIDFDDTSGDGFPTRDWAILINDNASGGASYFAIQDKTAGVIPVRIDAGAPLNAMFVADNGNIGFGTSMPQAELHVTGSDPGLRLEDTFAPNYVWELFANSFGFFVWDVVASTVPFQIKPGAPSFSLQVMGDGDVGLGTEFPEGKLHTNGDGVQLVLFESGDGGAVQVRFKTDSENRRFLAVNNANQVKSQIIFGDSEIKLTGATDSGANLWLSVGPAGIVTRGPTCNPGPCDAVFDPEVFTPLPIEDHAAAMWENKFLGAIGPTSPDQPVNLTEKMGGVIHELEVAHIYIGELHATNKSQEARIAAQEAAHAEQIAALMARVEALEATLQAK